MSFFISYRFLIEAKQNETNYYHYADKKIVETVIVFSKHHKLFKNYMNNNALKF